jgi:type I restriction enzyme S subunit
MKSFLQQAVQGKLVPQNLDDEPASVLLEKIRAEKQQLIKDGKIKKDKNESIIFKRDKSHYERIGNTERCIDDEIPFEISDNWAWCYLENISEYIQRGKSPKYSDIKKYPVIAQKCNQWNKFEIDKAKFIIPESIKSYGEDRILQNNDLLWNSTGLGTLGRIGIYKTSYNPYELAVADSHITVIRLIKSCINPYFIYYYFANPTVQSIIERLADGSTKQKELSTTTIKKYLVPLPPLTEQNRIVCEIEKLLPTIKTLN